MSDSMTLANLISDPKNARKHTPRNVGMIERALHEVGAARSIVVDENNVVLAGNATIEAAAAAGIERVQVVEADGQTIIAVRRSNLSPEQKAHLALYDNRAAELAEWDTDVLASLGEEIDLSAFWTKDEIAELLEQDIPTSGGGDDVPEVEEGPTRCQPGDLWMLGSHRLLCADNRTPECFDRLFQDETPTALITDPPYGIGGASMTMGKGQSDKPKAQRLSTGQEWDDDRPDITSLLDCAEWRCVWGGNYFTDVLAPTNDWLCWHKKNDDRSFSEFELAWTNYGKQARHLSHHWGGEEKQHITQKPVEVMVFSIEHCPDASLVFDPYLGSGTTLIACERAGRRCFGMEIDPRYADIVIKRWEAESGQRAERSDG